MYFFTLFLINYELNNVQLKYPILFYGYWKLIKNQKQTTVKLFDSNMKRPDELEHKAADIQFVFCLPNTTKLHDGRSELYVCGENERTHMSISLMRS